MYENNDETETDKCCKMEVEVKAANTHLLLDTLNKVMNPEDTK